MKIWGYSVLVFLLLGCNDKDKLVRYCGNMGYNKCYGVWTSIYKDPQLSSETSAKRYRWLAKQGLRGECHFGTPTCDENFNIIDCDGASYPIHEICNGLDDDCDGKADNIRGLPTKANFWSTYHQDDNPCVSRYGVCADAMVDCQDGQLVCQLPPTYEEEETLCDGLDNDCDSSIDELPPKGVCFPGDFNLVNVGVCKAGVEACIMGVWTCHGFVLSGPERCNGLDDDCDGMVDNIDQILSKKYDIVFNIDTSGSMCPYIQATVGAAEQYVTKYEDNDNFRFAIVNMSYYSFGSSVYVEEDFTDLGTIYAKLATIDCNGSGSEWSLDSMYMLGDVVNPLALSWRADAERIVFSLTDEVAQSHGNPASTPVSVVDRCLESQTEMYIWRGIYDYDYEYIATNTGGLVFLLREGIYPQEQIWEPIFKDMDSVISTLCQREN